MTKVNFNDLSTFNRLTHYITVEGQVLKRSWGERIVRALHLETFINKIVARIFPSLTFANYHDITSSNFRKNIKAAAKLESDKELVKAGLDKINQTLDHIGQVSNKTLKHIKISDDNATVTKLLPQEDNSPIIKSREATPPLPEEVEQLQGTTATDTNAAVVDGASSASNINWEEEYRLVVTADTLQTGGQLEESLEFADLPDLIDDSDVDEAQTKEAQVSVVDSLVVDVKEPEAQTLQEVNIQPVEKSVDESTKKLDARLAARDAEKAAPGTKQRAQISVIVDDSK